MIANHPHGPTWEGLFLHRDQRIFLNQQGEARIGIAGAHVKAPSIYNATKPLKGPL
jgi:hypothetical protein